MCYDSRGLGQATQSGAYIDIVDSFFSGLLLQDVILGKVVELELGSVPLSLSNVVASDFNLANCLLVSMPL